MKKNYQQPTTRVITLNTTMMICGSISEVSGVTGLGVDNNGTEDAGITMGNSRRNSLWDDDEEEEY